MISWDDITVKILPYLDGNGLVSPKKVSPGELSASGNGLMYTSELYIILDQLMIVDLIPYARRYTYRSLIAKCIGPEGMLNRVPVGQDGGQEGPDDYYGVLNACMQMGIQDIPRIFLKATLRHLGALNNVKPGHWTTQSFLIRQPQLLCCMIASAFPKPKDPLHVAIRLLFGPLFLFSASIIATAGMFSDRKEVEVRRLSWHLMKNLSPVSMLCRLASKLWYKRLYRDYGPRGMKAVASLYYGLDHPFSSYWID